MGTDGTITVVSAGRRFEILARDRMDEQLAVSLAISRGTTYLRTYDALYAISRQMPQNRDSPDAFLSSNVFVR